MKNIFSIIVIVLVLIGGYFLLNKKQETQNNEPIKIGMIAGLTGPYGAIGENYVKGAQLAIDLLKKEDKKSDITLIVENDDFDTKKALSAYEKLTGVDKVDALISETSSAIEAIYDRVTTLGIPVIQGGEQSRAPTDDNVIQIQPGYYKAEVALGKHIKESGKNNVVVFVQNYPAMLRFFDGFQEGYGKEGKKTLVNFGDKVMKTHALQAFQAKPDAIVFLMFPDDGALLLKELTNLYNKSTRPIFVFDANFQAGFSNYENILGDLKFLDGSIVNIVKQTMSPEFVTNYKKRWGVEPAIGSEFGFDAISALVNNYNSDPKRWVANIKSSQFEGVSGSIRFDDVGVRIPDFKNTTIKNGEIVY
ncbi:MAG: ABC transporter substrate-binding protein [bacterium]|nr:ABC transporter substrate-binding protein [bacterium]